MRGLLAVVSGPSGTGKGTVLEEFFTHHPAAKYSVSATTRPPRPGEIDGVHYFFVTEPVFRTMIDGGEFLEWARVHQAYYGTPRAAVDQVLDAGLDCILDIDVQGGKQVKASRPDAVQVFLAPPSLAELKRRLEHRHTEAPEAIARRLQTAQWELTQIREYEYCIVNEAVEDAARQLTAVLTAERCRVHRNEERITALERS